MRRGVRDEGSGVRGFSGLRMLDPGFHLRKYLGTLSFRSDFHGNVAKPFLVLAPKIINPDTILKSTLPGGFKAMNLYSQP